MKKKGFTLIELLAVIVILAIIAVIAVPIVINIIDESKENAGLRSAEMYLDAVEMSVAQAILKNKNIESKTYDIMNDGNICLETLTAGKCIGTGNRENNEEDILKVEVNGETPTSGKISITNGNISSIELNYKNGKTIVKNSDGDLVVAEKEESDKPSEEGGTTTPVCSVTSGNLDTPGSQVTCAGINFRVMPQDTTSHPLASVDTVSLLAEDVLVEDIGIGNLGKPYFVNDNNEVLSKYTSKANFVYDENSNIYTYMTTYKKELETAGVLVVEATLPSYNQFKTLGCQENDGNNIATCPTWIEDNYSMLWTGTSIKDEPANIYVLEATTLNGDFGPLVISGRIQYDTTPKTIPLIILNKEVNF